MRQRPETISLPPSALELDHAGRMKVLPGLWTKRRIEVRQLFPGVDIRETRSMFNLHMAADCSWQNR